MNKTILIETQFLPPISIFVEFSKTNKLIIEANENYQKRSYRNRCNFLNASGRCSFSLPLEKGKNQQTPIKNVRISYDTPWKSTFIKQLQSAYGKSPYFDHYLPGIDALLSKNFETLFELNTELLQFIFKALQLEINIYFSESYTIDSNPEICDLRNKFSPVSNESNYDNKYLKYPQVFEYKLGFTPGLSIIDLLFNLGPESSFHLNSKQFK